MTAYRCLAVAALLALAACGGATDPPPPPPPPPPSSCSAPTAVSLAPGQHTVQGATSGGGCFRFPSAPAEAEYLVGIVSGGATVSSGGTFGPYFVRVGSPASASASASAPVGAAPLQALEPGFPERFHAGLRASEARLAARPGARPPAVRAAPALAPPPTLGSERRFSVCKNLSCTAFDSVDAVAKFVGTKAAVYIDKIVPTADSLTQADFDDLGRAFDLYHYPIGSNAFGAESDLDANGVIIILLTDAVNTLTPDCTNGRVLGFFWGGDLLTVAGSNRGEIFYGMVPAPATPQCTAASRKQTVDRLKPTMLHELQHMISYNQHVLARSGPSEQFWLNEALSHYAEELGGRLIPNAECPGFSSCRSQYTSGNLFNAYDYLRDTEANFLVFPSSSSGTLKERGSGWLFLSWLADQFGTDATGSNLTRALVGTNLTGAANVQAATGQAFAPLVADWFLGVYVDDLAGFTPASRRLTYSNWGFRAVFLANCCTPNAPFEKAWPVDAPLITGTFTWSGTLRGGSGKHFRVLVGPGGSPLDLQLSRNSTGQALDAALDARVAIVRLR